MKGVPPSDPSFLANLCALAALAGVLAYALLGGADFGGGVWDLFAAGERKREQRLAIQKAMGPVWEANHVWLIFVVVVLFTCFPSGYSALGIHLFVPFHLALLGIMLRGASFVFRSHQSRTESAAAETSGWGVVFGVASVISPFILGAAFGAITEGAVRSPDSVSEPIGTPSDWLTPYCVATGFLALSTCAYLAAIYLTGETNGDLREDFRRRAIVVGTLTAALAAFVLYLASQEAAWFFDRLFSARTAPILVAGLVCFAGSAWAVFTRRWLLGRILSVGEITLVLLGWGVAQYPWMIYPDFPLATTAAPESTLRFVVLSLPFGGALLLPSLWFLFRVFKAKQLEV